MAKYPLEYYKYLVGEIVNFLEDKADIVEQFIQFLPKDQRERARDIFNQY